MCESKHINSLFIFQYQELQISGNHRQFLTKSHSLVGMPLFRYLFNPSVILIIGSRQCCFTPEGLEINLPLLMLTTEVLAIDFPHNLPVF